ncbi:MAG TPA: patatin-like phospholipase family protein [Gammaproteobacteria bacterium]|nr:patatin-like phospholipase family protein [Gammaproteobacteria bacterium]
MHRLPAVRRAPVAGLAVAALVLLAARGAAADPPEAAPDSQRQRVGLVLSGGGARGAAHVGVIKVLEELRVPIDAIAGTSMGAVIGGLYAAGLSAQDLEHQLRRIDWQEAFRDDPAREDLTFRRKQDDESFHVKFDIGYRDGSLVLPRGLIQGQHLNRILSILTLAVAAVDDFDELPIPFRAVAADIETGEGVVIGSGNLAVAMRASMSAPGVISPTPWDGRLLVDGGLANNLPIDIARQLGVDALVVVDVGSPLYDREDLDSALRISNQMLTILIRRAADAQRDTLTPADVVIEPEIGNYSSADFSDIPSLIPFGERAARAAAGALGRLALDETDYRAWQARRQDPPDRPPAIDFLRVDNGSKLSPRVIESRVQTEVGEPLDIATLERDMANLYGLDIFEQVNFSIVEESGLTGLEIDTVPKSWGPNYLRFGLTLEDDFQGSSNYNIGARYTMTEFNALGAEWRSDFQIGQNPRLSTEFYQPLTYDTRYFIAPHIEIEQRDLRVFENGEPQSEFRLTEQGIGLDAGRELANWGEIRIGLRRRHGDARLKIGDVTDPRIDDLDFNTGSYFMRFAYDRTDDANFPRHGSLFFLEWERARKELGSDASFDLVSANYLGTQSFGRNTFAAAVALGTTFAGEEDAIQDFYSLGGFLRLSGLQREELTGPHVALGELIYYRRVGETGGGVFDWPFYVGGSLEAGNVFGDRDDAAFNSLIFGGSLFLGLDTYLGPLYLASGFAESGERAFYLFLGRSFR